MYSKIEINGKINVVTGMHIGGSSQFSAIGSVDSPVIRDTKTNLPLLPGSSLKGKMRTLLAKKYNAKPVARPDDDHEILLRLFGSAAKGKVKRSRLLFSDMVLSNMTDLNAVGLHTATEVKFENNINRLTAVANPRQIERVIRGSVFDLKLIYEAESEDEMIEDFTVIKEGFKLLEYDYIGGSGSRGYGKVNITDIELEVVVGEVNSEKLEQCRLFLKEI